MSDDRNWNWAWSTVGTAINKHGSSLTPEQIARLIEQGIEHGIHLATAIFEVEALNTNYPVHYGPQAVVNKIRHKLYGEPEFPLYISEYQKPCGDSECACS